MTLPGLTALRTYQRAWLPRDLVAAVVLATLLVPQGMAYAKLAGLPSITGLYTTVVCLVAFSLVGSSPVLVLGPDSALGPMIAATILPLAAGSEELAIALAGMLALMVGLVTVGTGLARLGFVADLLSSPVRTGYLAGLALTIFVGQLPKLFGFSTDASGLVGEAVAFVQNLDQTNEWALAMGLASNYDPAGAPLSQRAGSLLSRQLWPDRRSASRMTSASSSSRSCSGSSAA